VFTCTCIVDLQFKPAADEIIWLHDGDLPEPLRLLEAVRSARVVRRQDNTRGTRVLGTVVGGDPHATAVAMRDLFQADHDQLIQCIRDSSMPLQMCVLMMRMILAPSVVHMLRTSPVP
jgi:hypothetical protein